MARWDITEILIMKKTALLLAIALFAVTFTSCQKTKPYNPKEKISKIYVGLGLEKNLSEAWNWEGNQLKSIEHYISIDNVQLNYYTEVFTYNDKGQVQNVKTEDGDFYTEYLYGTNDRLYIKDTRFSDVNTFVSTMGSVQIIYELATPIEIQLDSITLQALLNENNIWCDTGDTEVKYLLTENSA